MVVGLVFDSEGGTVVVAADVEIVHNVVAKHVTAETAWCMPG